MKILISFLGTITIYSVFEMGIKMYLPVWKDRITCTVKTRRCFVSFIFTLRKSIVILAEDQLAIHCISFQDTLFTKCTSSTILNFVTLAFQCNWLKLFSHEFSNYAKIMKQRYETQNFILSWHHRKINQAYYELLCLISHIMILSIYKKS